MGQVTLITGPEGPDGRTAPASDEVLEGLRTYATKFHRPLLVEADGSRGKPLKAPAAHEPPIPAFARTVVLVAGLRGLGKPLGPEWVHREERFSELSGLDHGGTVSSEALLTVLTHAEGGLKNMPTGARKAVLLNQADTAELQAKARELAPRLLSAFHAVIISSLQHGEVLAAHEPTAAIILAAGGAKRFGSPKQLLDWRGQPFIRAVAETAISAGLSPVIVVTGAEAQPIERAVSGLPITIVHNEAWGEGQASSIRSGLAACPETAGSAIFLLADQPQVPTGVLNGLVEAHAAGLAPIVAPLVRENRRGNPVLFDRTTFAALRALEGDEGGRAIFSKFQVEYLPWNDERLLLDVDTEADYRRLKEAYGE